MGIGATVLECCPDCLDFSAFGSSLSFRFELDDRRSKYSIGVNLADGRTIGGYHNISHHGKDEEKLKQLAEIEVGQLDGLQKRLKAKVVPYPHFDPTKERVKGNYE